jgi:hypothetical protein
MFAMLVLLPWKVEPERSWPNASLPALVLVLVLVLLPVRLVIPGKAKPPAGRPDWVGGGMDGMEEMEDGVIMRDKPGEGDNVPVDASAANTSRVGGRAPASPVIESNENEPSVRAGAGLEAELGGVVVFQRSANESDMGRWACGLQLCQSTDGWHSEIISSYQGKKMMMDAGCWV